MKRIALIPSYEPDFRLEDLVKELKKNKFEIVVVDDGSGKDYDKIFNNINKKCKVIRYDVNKGKGHALKTGMQYIKENYKDYIIITMDSDGQHTVSDAIKLCEYVESNPNEIALGKRIRSKNVPLRSRVGNAITKITYSIATGSSIYDTQTGLRCFSDKLIDFHLNTPGERFEYEMNILLYAPSYNIKMKEITIETIYIDNNSKSHFKAFKDSLRIYKQILKFSISSILSFIIDYLLYVLFIFSFNSIILANILARIISATFNFSLNRTFVFNSNKNLFKSLAEYTLLAVILLLLNTTLLNNLTIIGLNPYIAKILVEILLFFVSWLVQKKKIFSTHS